MTISILDRTMMSCHRKHMTPAPQIVELLGGNKAVADALGLERTAVQRWGYAPPNGRGGRIPQRYWPAILQLAEERKVPIALSDLLDDQLVNTKPSRRRRAA